MMNIHRNPSRTSKTWLSMLTDHMHKLPPPPSKLSALASGILGRDASVSSPVADSSGAGALGQGAKAPCTISSSTNTTDTDFRSQY